MPNQNSTNTTNSDYKSALDWANDYTQKSSPDQRKDNSINIFWISIVILLILLAAWWWWSNYKSKTPTIKSESVTDKLPEQSDIKIASK